MKKTYVIKLDNNHIRTIVTTEKIYVGSTVADSIFLGVKLPGGKVIKVY